MSLKSPDPTKEVRECYAELLTDLSGSKEELARALDYLRSEGVLVEKATEAEAWT